METHVYENERSFDITSVFSQRTKTLETSLEVMALEIFERIHLLSLHRENIKEEKIKLYTLVERAAHQILYKQRDAGDLKMFYERIWTLRSDERKEEVDCWKDIVMVIRDLLPVWQAQQQARSRVTLLEGDYER